MANGNQSNPIPPAPAAPPGVVVYSLKGQNAGHPGTIPLEDYQDEINSGTVELAAPTITPDGKPQWTPISRFQDAVSQGYAFDRSERTQIPLVLELTKQIQARDPGAVERFLAPWWNTLKSLVPPPTEKDLAGVGGESILAKGIKAAPGVGILTRDPFEESMEFAKIWASKLSSPEKTAATLSRVGVPFLPEVAMGVHELGEGNLAGSLGYFSLAGGMYLFQELAPWLSENVSRPVGEKLPDLLIGTRHARNIGGQREAIGLVNKISDQVLDSEDLRSIANSAGAEVRNSEARAAYEEALEKQQAQRLEQARRMSSIGDLEGLAREVSGPRSVAPIQQAERMMEVARGVKGITDEIETNAYEPAYARIEAEDVQADIAPVGRALAQETRFDFPAQTKLGVSAIPVRTFEGAMRMQQGAIGGLTQARQALDLADLGDLSPNELYALHGLVNAMQEGETRVPFRVADEAQRGLGTLIRGLQKRNDPKVAPEIRLLDGMRSSLKTQLAESLEEHPEALEFYEQARKVTFEQHEVIDQEYIRAFFGNPRYQLPGEELVAALLGSGKEKLQAGILRALEVGPEAQTALERIRSINPGEADRISHRIAEAVSQSEDARRGLRGIVVRAAMRQATSLSKTPGVTAPRVSWNKMISFLDQDARPGAKILLADSYEPLMRGLRARADAELRVEDPDLERFVQRETARAETKERVKAPTGAGEAAQEITIPEFVKKVRTDPTFRKAVVRSADPAMKLKIVQAGFRDAVERSMERGMPGSPDAAMDFEKLGKNIAETAQWVEDFADTGEPEGVGGAVRREAYKPRFDAARQLEGLGRAAERASETASTGLVARIYIWWAGFKNPGRMQPRGTGRISYGIYEVGPREIGKEIGAETPPVELSSEPRSLDADIFSASQDPRLAVLMKRALKMQPWSPGSGTFTLKYFLGFAGGKEGKEEKVLDDKTAEDILIQTGGKIEDAVKTAQAMGYTR